MATGTSAVWKFFEVQASDTSKAKCLVCKSKDIVTIITRGKTSKLFSTKPLWNHLKNSHPSVHKEIKPEDKEDPVKEEENHDVDVDDSLVPGTGQQPTIQQILQKQKTWEPSSKQAQKITRTICEMMAIDAEPFGIVEREGFRKLMSVLAPQYSIPHRTHFSLKASRVQTYSTVYQ